MKVPKHIKAKMQKIVQLNQAAAKEMKEVERWLEQRGFDTSECGLRDGCGASLEELEYGVDAVEELCERIESEER